MLKLPRFNARKENSSEQTRAQNFIVYKSALPLLLVTPLQRLFPADTEAPFSSQEIVVRAPRRQGWPSPTSSVCCALVASILRSNFLVLSPFSGSPSPCGSRGRVLSTLHHRLPLFVCSHLLALVSFFATADAVAFPGPTSLGLCGALAGRHFPSFQRLCPEQTRQSRRIPSPGKNFSLLEYLSSLGRKR